MSANHERPHQSAPAVIESELATKLLRGEPNRAGFQVPWTRRQQESSLAKVRPDRSFHVPSAQQPVWMETMRSLVVILCASLVLAACVTTTKPPLSEAQLVALGQEIFFNETFNGNGRTCGTCHPAENNFTIDAVFIATLPADDPLFVAEFNPDLQRNFENPELMREFALILENLDGFGDLSNQFTMRGVPHTLGMRVSVDSRDGPRTGLSGDGAPGDGSLRSFATGAVIQHFTKTLDRVPGVDFRLPSDDELDALVAFQLSLGRQADLALPLPLKGTLASRGQELFNDPTTGKCFACHFNAGANAEPNIFGPGAGNLNFNTGVEDLPDQPADLTGELVPPDDGFGRPGDGTFNTPSLAESADTGPFFHNNSVGTIEGAVGFYDGDSFNNSPAGQLLAQATGSGIEIDITQIVAISAFLRVINTLVNIQQSIELTRFGIATTSTSKSRALALVERASHETNDAIMVLTGGALHPKAVAHLVAAGQLAESAINSNTNFTRLAGDSIAELERARAELVETSN